jgi:hypothetical protein
MIIPKIFGSTIPKLKAPVALNSAPLNKSSGTIPWPLLGIAGEGPLGKVTALTMHSHLYSQKKRTAERSVAGRSFRFVIHLSHVSFIQNSNDSFYPGLVVYTALLVESIKVFHKQSHLMKYDRWFVSIPVMD